MEMKMIMITTMATVIDIHIAKDTIASKYSNKLIYIKYHMRIF